MRRLGPLLLLLFSGCSVLSNGPSCSVCRQPSLAGLPLVEVASTAAGNRFAILITGDNGWRAMDRDIAQQLSADGVPVVGLLANDYFADRKTPEQTAADVERIVRAYSSAWNRQQVVLIGYSRGAGVMPFIIARLSADVRANIAAIALIGIDNEIDFKAPRKFLLWNRRDERSIAVLPEMMKLRGTAHFLCFQGEGEDTSICPELPPDLARRIVEPGTHHLTVNYAEIAREIERSAP